MNTSLIFWLNYLIMSMSLYVIVWNPDWLSTIGFIISFSLVAFYRRWISRVERYLAMAITSTMCAGLFLIMTHSATSPLSKLLACVLSMFSFLAVGHLLCKAIESSNWFKNYKDKNNQLIAQENIGPEPDPKDFENS